MCEGEGEGEGECVREIDVYVPAVGWTRLSSSSVWILGPFSVSDHTHHSAFQCCFRSHCSLKIRLHGDRRSASEGEQAVAQIEIRLMV